MDALSAAQQAFQAGQFREAEAICRQILAQLPHEARTSFLLCDVLLATGRVAEAESLAADTLVHHPANSDLTTVRADALAKLNRADEALAAWIEATEQRISNGRAHDALAAELARRGDPTPRFSVAVVTSTIGTPLLAQAIAGVQAQDYPLVEHWIVADGPECLERVRTMLPAAPRHPVRLLSLPINTGAGGFHGHRVFGAVPYLVDVRYVAYLDEDNWFEPGHVSALMAKVHAGGLSWAYALRNIVDAEGKFICRDDCESLGQWPKWNTDDVHLVDVNCFVVRRDLAIAIGPLWYRRFPDQESPDFAITEQLLRFQPRTATSGRATVNYRVSMNPDSVPASFFIEGNAKMRERYGDKLPWRAEAEK